MNDQRIKNHAKLLVRYSIEAGKDETVGVSAGMLAEPLVLAVYEELLKVGAFPVVRMSPDGLSELLFKHGKPRHFTTLQPYSLAYAKCVDKTITIYSQSNTKALSGAAPEKQRALSRAMSPVAEILTRKKWTLTLHPTAAYAQDAEMGLGEFEDFVYGAMFVDEKDPIAAWKELGRKQERFVRRLRGADEIRIVGNGTDLRLSVKGRKFINSDGRRNMPSGEVFAAPVENSAEGIVEFDYPVCRDGREIEGVRLVFRKGVVVEATAAKNEAYLRAMLDADKGSKRLGELGIGTNVRVNRFIKNILFDEKIGGTIHLAVGRSPLGTGGKNRSAIHWDMIKDLRQGGAIYVDGKVFQRDGKFIP